MVNAFDIESILSRPSPPQPQPSSAASRPPVSVSSTYKSISSSSTPPALAHYKFPLKGIRGQQRKMRKDEISMEIKRQMLENNAGGIIGKDRRGLHNIKLCQVKKKKTNFVSPSIGHPLYSNTDFPLLIDALLDC